MLSELKIGPHVLPVNWIAGLKSDDDVVLDGRYRGTLALIEVNADIANTGVILDTIIHEALHAMRNSGNCPVPIDKEEELVRFYSPLIMGLLLENPKLLEMIYEEQQKRSAKVQSRKRKARPNPERRTTRAK
jgi:hypothetical protein